ncbi:hypothetical protein BDV97DRAFT_97222 [Delphinella strobiligena]|nr:hypothetical protein BDV97DRAFT_97222 [Delphinella strobiligena]
MSSSTHSEPKRQHTKEELMKPGHDHHLSSPPPCPDPSVHRDSKLQEQASSAALYVTRSKSVNAKENVLDANNKLSSRSAAQSLKYARPEDLPSYPVVGISTEGSAHSAANLANTNHKGFEHWKPDASSDAGKAAMLAKDYKMAPLWKPELSAAGSKAALLAHRDGGKVDLWMPTASAEGNSAAKLALGQKSTSPQLDYGYTEDGRKRALVAATGAVSRSNSRAVAPPTVVHPAYPDSKNSAKNALNAATAANKPSVRKPNTDPTAVSADAMRAARVQNYAPNTDRQMFTEHPPVEIEKEEKRQQAILRASAVAMAKQMYASQETKRREVEAAAASGAVGASAATAVHNRAASMQSTPDVKTQALQYIHLQEAAQKLAQERLAKLDPDGVARYRAHYGYEPEAPRNRMSLRGRPRRRADSEATNQAANNDDDSSDDEFASRRIRNQMSGLNNSVAEIDAKKRANDRASLLAAAERKVQAQMHSMDERVFQETGKVSPAMLESWEAKARAKANADSQVRQKNFGKVNIGGGRYMDQSELDAIAQARLQPTLNEIGESAEKRRAADEERRLEEEENKRQMQSETARLKDNKAEAKRLKAEEKAEAKARKKEEKAAAKARKVEEKQARRESKVRTKDAKKDAAEGAAISAAAHEGQQTEVEPTTESVVATEREATESEVAEPAVATETPLEKTETTDTTGTHATGRFSTEDGKNIRPDLERHVTNVVTSSSEGSSISSLDDSDSDVEGGHVTGRAIAARVVSHPVIEESAAAHPTVTTTTEPVVLEPVATETAATEPASTEPAAAKKVVIESPRVEDSIVSPTSEKRKSRGFSGFFGKFKRNSKAPGSFGTGAAQVNSPAASSTTRDGPTVAASSANVAGVAAPTADAASDSASSSSFRRHEADLRSISSMSSSSLDEDSGRRGRSAKTDSDRSNLASAHAAIANATAKARGNDTGAGLTAPAPATAGDDLEDEEDDEGEFEEARDHFEDATLQPPPAAAAAVRKSSDTGTETKFHEEL